MHSIEKQLEIAKNNNSEIISIKYFDKSGIFKQIDSTIFSFDSRRFMFNQIEPIPIEGKNFIDPFRSVATTNFFCENGLNKNDPRKIAREKFESSIYKFNSDLTIEVHFSINIADKQIEKNCYYIDNYANLRSDILLNLEKINVKTGFHYAEKNDKQCVIEIKGNDAIDLIDNFIIAKYMISNICNSYGLTANFDQEGKSNFSIIIGDSLDQINLLHKKISTHIINKNHIVKKESKDIDVKLFLLKSEHKNQSPALKINFTYQQDLNPYLVLIDSLVYN